MIRALVDANVLISHLLKPTASGPPNRIVRAAITQEFELVMIETTLVEMQASIQGKPYLNQRISKHSAQQLEAALRRSTRILPESIDTIPRLTRDPGDDYLLAHAVLFEVPFLVSGDRDLLDLGDKIEAVRIVSPADFVILLDGAEH